MNMFKQKRGVFGLNALIQAGIAFMVLSLVLTLSTGILQDEYDDRAADGDANVTLVAEKGIDGILKFAKKQTTIAGAVVAVAVIGIIMTVVGALRLRE
jgi:MFS superfamily sulfate permease-like transporter